MSKSVNTAICITILIAASVKQSKGVVTSDDFGTHVVQPGKLSYGIDLGGVAMLGIAVPPEEIEFFGEVIPICTGSLITDRHVLTAAHCFDSGIGQASENPDGEVDDLLRLDPYVARFESANETIAIEMDLDSVRFPSSWPLAEDDLAIVELVEDAPATIPRYSLLNHKRVVGKPIVIAGFGEPGHGSQGIQEEIFPPSLSQRAGLNRIEQLLDEEGFGVELLVYDFDSGLRENNSLQLAGVTSDLGFGVDEVLAGPGDSGGPNFVNGSIAGVLTLVESPQFGDVTTEIDASWGELGLSLPVANYREFVLSATKGQVRFVPEPDFHFHLAPALLFLMLRRT